MLRDHSRNVSIPPFPSKSIHNHSYTQVMSKSYQIQTALHRKRFFEHTRYSIEVQKHWKAFAVELIKENRSLKKKMKELERQLKGEVKYKGEQMARSLAANQEYEKETAAIKRTQQLQKVRGLWGGFEEFHSAHGQQREVVESVLEGQANKHCLNATDVAVKIPDLLLRECERELQMKRIGNTYVGGKLNLLSLVQLWNMSLRLLKEKIHQDSVPSFDESSPKIKNDVHKHQSLLSNAETLRSTLSNETIPELKESVEKLRTRLYQDMDEGKGTTEPQPYSFNLGLGLAPATPPVSFTAEETPASHRISSFQDSLRKTPVGVSTPDIVSSWTESLRGRKSQVQSRQSVLKDGFIETSKGRKEEFPSHIPKPKTAVSEFEKHQLRRKQGNKRLPHKGTSASAKKPLTSASSRLITKTMVHDTKTKNLTRTEPRRKVSKEHTKRVEEDLIPSKASAVNDVANQIIGVMSSDRPNSASGSSSQSSSRASTPKPQAIDDPMEALDETAFISRDLLMRTPAPKEKYAPSPVTSSTTHTRDDDDDTLKQSYTVSHQKESESKSLNRSARLLETILNQTNEPLSAAKVKTALFPPSPEEQVNSPFTKILQASDSHTLDSQMPKPALDEGAFYRNELLSPFVFETPKLSRAPVNGEDEILDLHEPTLLTPFSFVTPLSKENSRNENLTEGLSPFCTYKKSDLEGPTTVPCGTPSKIDGADSFLNLSDALEEKLRLSGEKPFSQIGTPSKGVTVSSFSHSKTPTSTFASPSAGSFTQVNSRMDKAAECKLSPQISLFEPTIGQEGKGAWTLSEDEVSRLDKKNSPFGGLEISDDEEDIAGREKSPEHSVGVSSFKEMKDSDLMSRLNKIKQAQQRYDLKYSLPGRGASKLDQERPGADEHNGSINGEADGSVTMETSQARKSDRIPEKQQVFPGSFAGIDSPHTANTKDSPQHLNGEDGVKSPVEILTTGLTRETTGTPSNGSTPTSILSERFLLKSPFGVEKDDYLNDPPYRVFTLDSPMASPDVGHNYSPKFYVGKEGSTFYSPNGTSDHSPDKYSLSKDLDIKYRLSPLVEPLENRSPLLSTASDNAIKDFWTSSHATPKGLTISGDRRLSYDNFLNESVDSSFLVQDTPFASRVPKSLQGSSQGNDHDTSLTHSPSYDTREQSQDKTNSNLMTARSPAVGQLIDL